MRSLVTFIVLVASFALPGPSGAALDFSGDYTIADPEGSMLLHLEQSEDGEIVGQLSGPSGRCELAGFVQLEEDEEESEWLLEGELRCGSSVASIEFSRDDEEFLLLFIPHDLAGTPDTASAVVYYAQPAASGQPIAQQQTLSQTQAQTQASTTTRDLRLVGTWSTQVMVNTPQGNMATQILMEIRADGQLIDLGSRFMGSGSGVEMDSGLEGGGEIMAWRTHAGILELSSVASPWVALARYELTAEGLYLRYYDGDQKIWYRQ